MTPASHDRIKELFNAAVELPIDERREFLERECSGDAVLKAELEEMLAFDGEGSSFLTEPITPVAGTADGTVGFDATPFSGQVVQRLEARKGRESRYQVLGEFARGGMGAILRVWDRDLRRTLAMKVVLNKRQQSAGSEVAAYESKLGRFLEEAQVTGQLDHPGIVPVHELGIGEDGRVFFTMKLVKGRDLKEIFDLLSEGTEAWTQARALGVVSKVCDAMSYAHSKGVIHRDLKPANIMVGRFGEVYVMDWGLARVSGQQDVKDLRLRPVESLSISNVRTDRREEVSGESPLMTMDGDVVGTPAYMSPEQARGDITAMSPASDVYSLGAILYHLLAGQMPYVAPGAGLGAHAVWSMLRAGPPTALPSIAPNVSEELVAITEKAMSRDPSERYPDMGALGKDLTAFIEGRVVRAHRTGSVIELRKWITRNRGLASAIALAGILSVVGTATSVSLYLRAKAGEEDAIEKEKNARDAEALASSEADRASAQADRANREATRANEEADRANEQAALAKAASRQAEQQSYVNNFRAATISFDAGNLNAARTALDSCAILHRGWEWRHYDLLDSLARRGWNRALRLETEASRVSSVAFSSDGVHVATASEQGGLDFWDATTGEYSRALAHTVANVRQLAFRPGSSELAYASGDSLLSLGNAATGAHIRDFKGHTARVTVLDFSTNGKLLLSGSDDGSLRVWDVDLGTPVASFMGHEAGVREFSLLADGRKLATVSNQDILRVWDFASRELEDSMEVTAFAAHPNHSLLARAHGNTIQLVDASSGEMLSTLEGHEQEVYRLEFDPKTSRLVSAAWDESLGLWDCDTGERIAHLSGHREFVSDISFSTSTPVFVTASWDRSVRLWHASHGRPLTTLPPLPGWISALALDSTASRLVTASAEELFLWDGVDSGAMATWDVADEGFAWARYSDQGDRIVLKSADGKLVQLDATSGQRTSFVDPSTGADKDLGTRQGFQVYWQAMTGESLDSGHEHNPSILATSSDGRRVAAACSDINTAICVWDRDTGALAQHLQHERAGWNKNIHAVAISSDASLVSLGIDDGEIQLWSVESGELSKSWKSGTESIRSLAFDPTALRLLSCRADGELEVWDGHKNWHGESIFGTRLFQSTRVSRATIVETAANLLVSEADVRYSPDGKSIVAGFSDGSLRVWDARTLAMLWTLEGHLGAVTSIDFSPDGHRLLSAARDNTVRVWDAHSGDALVSFDGPEPRPEQPGDEANLNEEASSLEQGGLDVSRANEVDPPVEDAGALVSPDGTLENPITADETIAEWRRAMLQTEQKLVEVTSIVFDPTGKRILAAFGDGRLRCWFTDPVEVRRSWVNQREESVRQTTERDR